MGILLSALAAAGDAGVQSMNQNIEQQNRMDLEEQRSRLAQAKEQYLAEHNVDYKNAADLAMTNKVRDAQVSRIDGAQEGIIRRVLDVKYAEADAAAAGNNDAPLSQEQQAVIDTARGADVADLKGDARTRIQAAIQTGDISPKDAMADTTKGEMAQLRAEGRERDTKMRETLQELRLDAAKDLKVDGKVSASIATSGLNAEKTNINYAAGRISDLTARMKDPLLGLDEGAKAELGNQIKTYEQEVRDSQSNMKMYLRNLGQPETGAGATAAPASPKSAVTKGDNYVVGKKYRDGNGNVATYAGNGKFN